MYLIEGHKVTLLYLPFPLSSRCTLFLTILNSYRQVEKWKNCNKYKYMYLHFKERGLHGASLEQNDYYISLLVAFLSEGSQSTLSFFCTEDKN